METRLKVRGYPSYTPTSLLFSSFTSGFLPFYPSFAGWVVLVFHTWWMDGRRRWRGEEEEVGW